MFYNCTALESIFFGSGMTYVNDWAFQGCTALTDVYYNGTEAQRNEKFPEYAMGWDNDALKNATWHFILEDERPIDASVAFGRGVFYKGTTPYVIANGTAQAPELIIKDENGTPVGPLYYDAVFSENTNAGTAYVDVTFKNGYSGTAQAWFKIYLPATENTYVENVSNGIKVTWDPVEGAAGYVVYRRAWSSTTNGWTEFKRWNNTTDTTYVDGTDDAHKVYAGTRYQYGVKAYFDDPMDNFNLGIVGPLKTTVRITTRKLLGVDAAKQQMTVRWSGSKYCTGYQIKYSTDPDFKKDVVAYKVTRPDAYRSTVKDLASGTTYYVTVRSYTVFGSMTYFGEWSNVLSTKIK